MVRFSYEDAGGTTHLKAWALPLIVAAICVPIVAAFAAGTQGAAVGAATAFLVASTIVIIAARTRPFAAMEVAGASSPGKRVLLVAPGDLSTTEIERIAEMAKGAVDVRVLVPATSGRLDRWLSSEDRAVAAAREALAGTAGALTAAGLRVSGSVGDSDPVQAVEDELRSFAADEVIVFERNGDRDCAEKLRHRLALPVTRLTN